MHDDQKQRIEVSAQAVRGLHELEPDPERMVNHLDFIDIYIGLDEEEQRIYYQQYPGETEFDK